MLRRTFLRGVVAAPAILLPTRKLRAVSWTNPRGNSSLDPLWFDRTQSPNDNNNVNGLTQVSPNLGGGRTVVIVAIGDSLWGNLLSFDNASPPIVTVANPDVVQTMDVNTGAIYKMSNTAGLYGMVGTSANPQQFPTTPLSAFWRQIADELVTAGLAARVIVLCIAVGATTSGQWVQNGVLAPGSLGATTVWRRVIAAGRRLALLKLDQATVLTTICLGTNDAGLEDSFGYLLTQYFGTHMSALVDACRAYIGGAIFLNRASWIAIAPSTVGHAATMTTTMNNALASLVNNTDVFAAADTNTLDNTYRQDGVHWSFATGFPAVTALVKAPLVSWLNSH